jgi:hypothetical protein
VNGNTSAVLAVILIPVDIEATASTSVFESHDKPITGPVAYAIAVPYRTGIGQTDKHV